jgi:hypothetical protein
MNDMFSTLDNSCKTEVYCMKGYSSEKTST